MFSQTISFFNKKHFYKKMSLKNPQASNAWAAIFKNADFSQASLKHWAYFSIFYLKFLSVFIINASTILFSKHGKIKR